MSKIEMGPAEIPEVGSGEVMSLGFKEPAGKREVKSPPFIEYVFLDVHETMVKAGREFASPLIDGLVELGIPEDIAMRCVLEDKGALSSVVFDKAMRDPVVRRLDLKIDKRQKENMFIRVRRKRQKHAGDAYEEVPGALKVLHSEGYKLIADSNADRQAIYTALRRAGLQKDLFRLVIGGDCGREDEVFEKGEKHYVYAAWELEKDKPSFSYTRFLERSVQVDDTPSTFERIIKREEIMGTGIQLIGCARRDPALRRRFNALGVPVVDDFTELVRMLKKLNSGSRAAI